MYVSFGSQAWYQPARYRAICAATRDLDVDVLIAMGDLADEMSAELEAGGRVRCVRFAPQLDALAEARAAITHGGANSVMEALALGVPLLVAPICNDQPHNLWFVERAGAGRGVDLSALSPAPAATAAATETPSVPQDAPQDAPPASLPGARSDSLAGVLRDALRALLADGPERAAAARVAASYAGRSGADGAADLADRNARPATRPIASGPRRARGPGAGPGGRGDAT